MSLGVQSTVFDLANEFLATSGAVFTLFNNANVSSGVLYDKLTEANATLQGWTGVGVSGAGVGNALAAEQIKRFEVNYAAARLAANLAGLTITDGFNVNLGGLSVQRVTAQQATYKAFIDNHFMVAKEYIKMLHPWFLVYNSVTPQGYDENGAPVTYWNTSQARDYGG